MIVDKSFNLTEWGGEGNWPHAAEPSGTQYVRVFENCNVKVRLWGGTDAGQV